MVHCMCTIIPTVANVLYIHVQCHLWLMYYIYCYSPLYTAESLRWGKTYWQAASEQSERPVVDVEVDAHIEGSLAAEASLIVLDIMEQLMQTISTRENLHSTLGRVSKHSAAINTYMHMCTVKT